MFNEVVGNETSINLLRAIVARQIGEVHVIAIPQSFIFDGPSGSGKTMIAKQFAMELTGEKPKKFDYRQYATLSSWEDLGDYSYIIFEDAHLIPKESWEFLCVLLDAPSFSSTFIFTTTDYSKLPQNIKSRAFRVPLSNLSEEETIGFLSSICAKFDCNYHLSALRYIAQASQGNPKLAMNLLQKCDLLGEISLENATRIAPNDLNTICHSILCKIGQGKNIEAQMLLIECKSPPESIIDTLFTTYAAMYHGKLPGLEKKISDLNRITSIFLKWKQGISINSNCLPLLLSELMETPKSVSMVVDYNNQPIVKEEPPEREIGARELARLLHAKW